MRYWIGLDVLLFITVPKKGAVSVVLEGRNCLDEARTLARMLGGCVHLCLTTPGATWGFYRPARFRVSKATRKVVGRRRARKLEAEMNAELRELTVRAR